ncbi:MAG: hypothetical protein GY813_09295 [Halieaceae bacterium]|nr:hypothetical protein [Halieaceae bacterium]
MTPNLSAELHRAGLLPLRDALWIFGECGRVVANNPALVRALTGEEIE